jgi:uncharacterized protein
MDRLFLDANILFSAACRRDSGLLQFWRLPGAILCSSRYAFAEARFNLELAEQQRRLENLARRIHFFEAPSRQLSPGMSLPEKDAPIFLAALEAQATHLITGDMRDFGAYFGKRVDGILVLRPAQYLSLRRRT